MVINYQNRNRIRKFNEASTFLPKICRFVIQKIFHKINHIDNYSSLITAAFRIILNIFHFNGIPVIINNGTELVHPIF